MIKTHRKGAAYCNAERRSNSLQERRFRQGAFMPFLTRLVTILTVLILYAGAPLLAARSPQDVHNAESISHIEPRSNQSTPSAPDPTLRAFFDRSGKQAQHLKAFSATSLFQASLASTSQKAGLEVLISYIAPRTLQFTQIWSVGDPFVKRNIIFRALQSQADHVVRQQAPRSAINTSNYSFRFRRIDVVAGRHLHVYSVKPRRKAPDLFNGEIYLDSVTGSLARVKGTVAKSPSVFIRSIDFVQDYTDFDEFTVPVRLHSVVGTRIVGKVILDTFTTNYSLSVQHGTELIANNTQ
jgi:hypothetical protein